MARTKAVLGSGARLADYLSASLLARVVPAEMVHDVLNAHGRNSQRLHSFPAVADTLRLIPRWKPVPRSGSHHVGQGCGLLRQVLQVIDAFIERGQLKRKAESRA